MDISVLTEQRRENVINLLKGMKIRKSDGEGFDKDDVYACMQQLCDVYEKSIDDLTLGYESELGELQDKYQKYDENNDLYISLIMEAKKSSNEIINKAKAEVDEILAAGKEQIAAQEEEIERVRAEAAQEKADLDAELVAARAAVEQEKLDLAAGIEEEKLHAEAVREQYKDQIAVMDQEFDEIKTNILRTAGKIDGLKAQLEEAGEETVWQLQDEPAPVEEPAAEVEEPAAPEELSFEELVAKLQADDAKAVQVAEVEAPAEPPVVEPELEAEAPLEEFSFEPTFDAPAETEEPAAEAPAFEGFFEELGPDVPAFDAPAEEAPAEEPADLPEVEISLEEAPAFEEPADIPAEPAFPELDLDAVVNEAAEEVAPDAISFDDVAEEATSEAAAAEEGLASIDDLALEEISIDLPEEAPAEADEPVEEISFEGLEELFKE